MNRRGTIARTSPRPGAPMRIAQVAPPVEAVPPPGYGGTERIVAALTAELTRRGHDLTLFASGDSTARARLIPTVARALRGSGVAADPWPYVVSTMLEVLHHEGSFDVIHAHLEGAGLLLARATRSPVVVTFHGRLDQPWAARTLADPAAQLVAISAAQASTRPSAAWTAVIHNGLDLTASPFSEAPGEDLCFVGRIAPEKGILDAISIARLSGRRLRVAAKAGWTPTELAYHEAVFLPALRTADVEYLGELSGAERDRLLATSYATLMPGSWPEPFGLVAIESLACGTPVVARPVGALPEIVREGRDGYLASRTATLARRLADVAGLDRREIRRSVLERFSATRMTDAYERIYRTVVADREGRADLRSGS
ncbi:MAG: glycosyltransferase family 4 protein [Chloroflexi bacterium]|nr:glycosyltransferase family 4 protein [Chloroflexota bacterium]